MADSTFFVPPFALHNCKRIREDFSNEIQEVYIEIPPYAQDDKGVIINSKSYPVLKKNGTINVQDMIQSHIDECDLAMLYEKFIRTGDESILNARVPFFADMYGAPKNFLEAQRYANEAFDNYSKLNDSDRAVIARLLGFKVNESQSTVKVPDVDLGGGNNESK